MSDCYEQSWGDDCLPRGIQPVCTVVGCSYCCASVDAVRSAICADDEHRHNHQPVLRVVLAIVCRLISHRRGAVPMVHCVFAQVFADVLPPMLQDAVGNGAGSFLVDRSSLLVLVTLLLLIPVVMVRTISGFILASLVRSSTSDTLPADCSLFRLRLQERHCLPYLP